MTAYFVVMAMGYRQWQSYTAALFVAATVGVTYTLFVKYNVYEALTNFLCRLAGKPHVDLQNRERVLYGVIGMTLFIPGLLAVFTVPYLLQASFGASVGISYLMAIPFVFLIFLVDRAFVATMGYKKKIGVFFIRFAIAGLLGWFLAQPIELQLFHKEVEEELAEQGVQKLAAIEADWQDEQDRLDGQEKAAGVELERARTEYEKEVNTSIGGRQAGHGPEAKKKLEYWEEQKVVFAAKKEAIDAERARLKEVFDNKKKTYQDTQSQGLGAQIQAFHAASKKYPPIKIYHWVIMLTILCIDLSPLLAKFLMTKTPSDRKEEEEDMIAEHKKSEIQIDHKYALMTKEIEGMISMIQQLDLSDSERASFHEGERRRIIKKYYGEDALHDITPLPISAN
ncbi:MAG: DUF4407 domain-containing protein [Candidatus Peribacteria bacterium]|nr:MAG: DUF4407 domain-containing protein [Candidatus Peribacteria bacterium]